MDISDTVSVQYNPVDDIEINQKAKMENIEYPSNIKNFCYDRSLGRSERI